MQSKKSTVLVKAEKDFSEYFEAIFNRVRHDWQKGSAPETPVRSRFFEHRVRHA